MDALHTNQKEIVSTASLNADPESILSVDAKEKILSVGEPLKNSAQIDNYGKLEEIRNRERVK